MLNPGSVGLQIVDAFCSGMAMVTTSSAKLSPEVAYFRNGEMVFMQRILQKNTVRQ